MDEGFRLVGFLNIFSFFPDFVYPVFVNNEKYFFQDGTTIDKIEEFVEVREDVLDMIYWTKEDQGVIISLESNPIYAFQFEDKKVVFGPASPLAALLKDIQCDNKVLMKEIKDFQKEIDDIRKRNEMINTIAVALKNKIYRIERDKLYKGINRTPYSLESAKPESGRKPNYPSFKGGMNKGQLIDAIAARTYMTRKESEVALNGIIEVISTSMAKGERVQITGFGTFDVKSRPARVARNPRTGASVKIAASKAPAFKAGKALKDTVGIAAAKKSGRVTTKAAKNNTAKTTARKKNR